MEITLHSPLDMHVHLRDGDMLKLVAPLTSKTFSWGIVMPNLVPPVMTKEDVIAYKKRIIDSIWDDKFEPFMTVFFHEGLNYDILKELKDHIVWIKLYPAWITTNSENGISGFDLNKIWHIFQAMSDLWIILCVHWETNWFVMDREAEFSSIYEMLAKNYPKLKIIMEHITTKALADLLPKYENLYATVTLHHLMITLDDVAWGMLKPHLFCKPIAKRYEDRAALLNLALNAHPKLMFWSDSAPHPKHKKESCWCAAWVFTAPIALQILVELFEKNWKLENLEKFLTWNAVNIYGIKPIKKEITLEKKDFMIPENYWDVIPFMAWETIKWSLK